jgi:hypothetical protein
MEKVERSKEDRRWHLSWMITALSTFAASGLSILNGIEMVPLIWIAAVVLAIMLLIVWIATPIRTHKVGKILMTTLLALSAAWTIWWAVKYDRPILDLKMQQVVIGNGAESEFGLDLETTVKNSGHQNGSGDHWQLELVINGGRVEGDERFGQVPPPAATNEPDLSTQDFPVGKPVRGWLFFSFPTVSHEFAAKNFACGSPSIDKISLNLSVWDSKFKRQFSQSEALKDLGGGACIAMTSPSASAPVQPAPKIQPTKAQRDAWETEATEIRKKYEAAHPGAKQDQVVFEVNKELRRRHIPVTIFIDFSHASQPSQPCYPNGIKIFANHSDLSDITSTGCFETGIEITGDNNTEHGVHAYSAPTTPAPSTTPTAQPPAPTTQPQQPKSF